MNPLAPLAEIGLSQKGIHEDGDSNAGSAIAKYQAATNLGGQGWPWCCAFVDWCIKTFIERYPDVLSVNAQSRPKTAAVFEFRDWAKGAQMVFAPQKLPPYWVQAGDIVIFKFSHIGIITGPASADGKSFPTVEGNTNVAGARDGGEVYPKTRSFESVDSFIRLSLKPGVGAPPAASDAVLEKQSAGVRANLIPDEAIQLILGAEGNDQPSKWPGGDSGISMGRGYDLSAENEQELRTDWKFYLQPSQLDRLARAVGLHGNAARDIAPQFADIKITLDSANAVFFAATLPKYYDTTRKAFSPGFDALDTRIKGALVSLVFNRGPGMTDSPGSDRRLEMRQIKALVAAGDTNSLKQIPDRIRSMKRLWQNANLEGLITRREDEARLAESAFT